MSSFRPIAVLIFSGAWLIGCNDKSRCGDDTECPKVDPPAGELAAEVHFEAGQSIVVSVDGVARPHVLTGGRAVFEATDDRCAADCDYRLESLVFELDRLVISTDPGQLVVEAPRLGVTGPVTVAFDEDYSLPEGTEVWGCARVDDELLSTRMDLSREARLVIDPENSIFSFEGQLPFEFRAVGNRDCQSFELVASEFPPAASPWDQYPSCLGGGCSEQP